MRKKTKSFRLLLQEPWSDLTLESSNGKLSWERISELEILAEVDGVRLDPGPPATVIRVAGRHTFSFFLRDVRPARPLWYPEVGAAITDGDEDSSYAGLYRAHPPPDADPPPEYSLEEAMRAFPGPVTPVWLALEGDARTILVSYAEDHGCWGWITPWRFHRPLLRDDGSRVEWDFTVGRGSHHRHDITRRLEDGMLPIVHSTQREEGLSYQLTLFATRDTGNLAGDPPRGTDWRAAYMSCMGCMFSKERLAELEKLYREEVDERGDRPVCCLRVSVKNEGAVPAYAFYRMPSYKPNHLPPMYPSLAKANEKLALDPATGYCHEGDTVFSLNFCNGRPLPNEEISVLLEPGEEAVFECRLPFKPLPPERAEALASYSWEDLHRDCRSYWQTRLADFPRWNLPEKALEERLGAGNLHLAVNTLGERHREETPLLSTVGVYAPIGTESTGALWHLDAMGHHDTVRRCLDYFYEIQREDGYIQSFNFYDAETGPVLANTWKHYLVTGNIGWLQRRREHIARACQYLAKRRERTMDQDGAGHPGYGMLSGKIADPDEYFHQFSLNAEAAEGLRGGGLILQALGDTRAESILQAASALAQATVRGFKKALDEAPLVPGQDQRWAPFIGGWPGTRGEVSLYADRGRWFTHGSFHARAQSFLKLVRSGLLPADDPRVAALVRSLESTVLRDYTGPSQPYNQRSDYYYAATGQVEKFSQLFYRQLARLQDRETYTFWEHYYKLSSQKINEEAWFLQQLTWMLCFEEGDGLTFFKMAPTAWFAPGRKIEVESMTTTCGKVSFAAEMAEDTMEVKIQRDPGPVRNPARLGLRIPIARFQSAETGLWNPASEILELNPEPGQFHFRVQLSPK